jgi:hypothetical protein
MATRNAPVSCTIDGTTFTAAEAVFALEAETAHLGVAHSAVPIMSAHVRIDLNDKESCDFNTIKKLFELSKLPQSESVKDIKIEFWVDLSDKNANCQYAFKGWISSFRTSFLGRSNTAYNHVVDLVLSVERTQKSFGECRISN